MSCPRLKTLIIGTLTFTALLFPFPVLAVPADYQRCTIGETCTIGEFLYDDEYIPITDAACTLTSRDPSGALLLNGVALVAQADGWYSHDLDTSSLSTGLYRSQVCCTTTTSDYLCIDKSFTVNEPGLTMTDVENAVWDATASSHTTSGSFGDRVGQTSTLTTDDIWSYPSRTLTGFGSLVSDIWSYSSRSLTNITNIITGIWSSDNRTLTDDTIATENDVNAIKNDINNNINEVDSQQNSNYLSLQNQITNTQTEIENNQTNTSVEINQLSQVVNENRNLLEALVNEPIIQTSMDFDSNDDLSGKFEKTKLSANELFAYTQQLNSRLGLLNLKWSQLNSGQIRDELKSIVDLLGRDAQTQDEKTVIGQVNWWQNAWGGSISDDLDYQAVELSQILTELEQNTHLSADASSIKLSLAMTHLDEMERLIGDVSNGEGEFTLFGYIKHLETVIAALDRHQEALTQLLDKWDSYSAIDRSKEIESLKLSLLKVNRFSHPTAILNIKQEDPAKQQRNQVYGLQALTGINKQLLAKSVNDTVSGLWLEEGSVIFNALIINPSKRIAQTAHLQFFLPKEVKEENILDRDDSVSLKWDATTGALSIEGDYPLGPDQSQLVRVRVNDIWLIPESDILSLKEQAASLLKPLEDTNYYGQGATLKSDIDVALDKILSAQASVRTPEARIRTYREAQLELLGVNDKLTALKDLVTQASAQGSLFGFVGGVQTVAVWGIVFIVIAGFVFLSLYMRALRREAYASIAPVTPTAPAIELPTPSLPQFAPRVNFKLPQLPQSVTLNDTSARFFQMLVIILSTTILTVIVISTILYNPMVSPNSPTSSLPQTPVVAALDRTIAELIVPHNAPAVIRDLPQNDGAIIATIRKTQPVTLIEQSGSWYKVTAQSDGQPVTGWISEGYIKPATVLK